MSVNDNPGGPPPEQPPAPEQNPWSVYEAAGLSPEHLPNPVDLNNALQFAAQMGDETLRPQMLPRHLEHWDPEAFEGLDYDTIRGLAMQHRQQMNEPFGQQPPPQYADQGYGQPEQYPPGYQPETQYQQPQPQGIDPRAFWEQIQNPIDQRVQQTVQAALAQERQSYERQRNMDIINMETERLGLPSEVSNDPRFREQMAFQLNNAIERAQQTGQPVDDQLIRGLPAQTVDYFRTMSLALNGAQIQATAPNTTTPSGPAPTGANPIQGRNAIDEAAKQWAADVNASRSQQQ